MRGRREEGGIDTVGLALPKINPLHLPSKRTMLKASYRTLRPDVRRDTWTRDGQRCRCCRKLVLLVTDNPFQLANIHERHGGHLRAEEAIDITLRSTITYCHACHEAVERNKLKEQVLDEEQSYNGPVSYTGTLPSGERLRTARVTLPDCSPQDARKP